MKVALYLHSVPSVGRAKLQAGQHDSFHQQVIPLKKEKERSGSRPRLNQANNTTETLTFQQYYLKPGHSEYSIPRALASDVLIAVCERTDQYCASVAPIVVYVSTIVRRLDLSHAM
jgi:hypothetical protein